MSELEKIEEKEKLDPNVPVSLSDLEKVDFTKGKNPELLKLEAEIASAAVRKTLAESDPFFQVFILQYKSQGPINTILFRSDRPPAVITRDCQVWCKNHGYRYISWNPALINLFDEVYGQGQLGSGPTAGDVTDIVTRQSRLPNSHPLKQLGT